MRILVVSRSWPPSERSGVSLTAAAHVEMLVELGHDVAILGAHAAVLDATLAVRRRLHVQASGSGAFYAPVRIDRRRLRATMLEHGPDLVVVEAWQTALTDSAVDAAFDLGIAVLMVSHGVSVHAFSRRPADRVRAWAWTTYRHNRLPQLVAKLSAITTLAETVRSPRFHDRDLALQRGIPILPLANFPINWTPRYRERSQRTRQLLVVGYFSAVKNQLAALEVLRLLPADITLRFIGSRNGPYFERCVRRCAALGLGSRVIFSEDHECELADEIGSSFAMLLPSLTEALPVCLLEAMASGTPFVATPVGAVPALESAIVEADIAGQAAALQALSSDPALWERQSRRCRQEHEARFSRARICEQISAAVELAQRVGTRNRDAAQRPDGNRA